MDPKFIEKEHPKNRPVEPADPMELNAEGAPGDAWVMLDVIVEEYARMGWSAEKMMELFTDPFFQATSGLTRMFGEEAVRNRVTETLARCGVLRVRITEAPKEAPEKWVLADRDVTPDGASVPQQPKEPNDA